MEKVRQHSCKHNPQETKSYKDLGTAGGTAEATGAVGVGVVGAGTATAVWDRNGEITDGGFVAVGGVTASASSATDDGNPAAFSASSRATCIHVAPIHQ